MPIVWVVCCHQSIYQSVLEINVIPSAVPFGPYVNHTFIANDGQNFNLFCQKNSTKVQQKQYKTNLLAQQ